MKLSQDMQLIQKLRHDQKRMKKVFEVMSGTKVTNSAGTLQTPNANVSEEEDEEFLTELQNLKAQEKEAYSTSILEDTPEILDFRRELDELAQKHFREVSKNKATSTNSVNSGIFDEASYDDDGMVHDFNNLPTEVAVSPIPTLRIHNIHPQSQILDDPKSSVQTRSRVQQHSGAHAPEEPKKITEALKDDSWVEAMQDELLQFRDARGVVVRNKARLVGQGHRQEEGIDYDEVFALVARIEAIRFVVPDHPRGYKLSKIILITSSFLELILNEFYGELIFFLGLQVKQKTDGIFYILKTRQADQKKGKRKKKKAVDQPSSSEPLSSSSHPPVISATTESEPTPVTDPTPHPTSPSPDPDSEPIEHTFEQPSPEHQPLSPRQKTEVPQSQEPTHSHVAEERTMSVNDLLQLVPKLLTKVDSFETELQQTKLTIGKALVKLVKKVKKMEDVLKRRHVVLPDLVDEDADILSKQGGIYKRKERKISALQPWKQLKLCQSGPVSSARGQREGKAPMIIEETQAPKRTKEQIQQEEASLAEAIRLQTLEEEETAKQVHLDALLAKRMEEEELTKQQKQRKAQVQFEAQHYTKEDWDAIRAKLEANAELTKNVLGKELPEEDFAKKMVELVNQRKKFFAEERAKARRSKPMTQSLLRNYMMNYLKNQGTWKLTQLKKLSFEEVKEEFDKLVKQVESFVPINIEATKAQLKRYGEELQTEISKKQRIDVSDTEEKGVHKEIQETDKEESVEAMNPTPLDTKSNIVANWKIFQQGERSIYQIIRANGADTVYMSFGAMLKDFTREDLIELYRLVMQKYGTNRPKDAYDRVLWSDLRTMFDPPLNEDAIWSLPLQRKDSNRKYPLSKDACQVMLKMKLLDGKMNEVCYKLLKMIEKQAGVKK
ncbi:putative ribonuclease H-like domain-containing protein [Tanacetum coccineum]